VEHIVAEAEEYAKAMLFTLGGTGSVPCFQLSLGLIVVFDGRHLLIVRHVKVIVEITAKRGKPRQAPAYFRLVGFQGCGARDKSTKVVSRSFSGDKSPSAFTCLVQAGQPLSQFGSNMK
jgi:hypothetical protein